MTKREALRIVRILIKAYEAGDSNETLAFALQQEVKPKANPFAGITGTIADYNPDGTSYPLRGDD